jgi:anaerobic magnesium-protoporphyrin IX monomethyl ester cyclase
MKVLLIYPYCLEKRIHQEDISVVPIGLYYIGAILKEHGHTVEVLNWHDADPATRQMDDTLRSKAPDVIGVSILHANRWGGLEIAQCAKKIDPNIVTVFGGIGATFLWEHLLSHFAAVDYVVTGEGELAFLQLLGILQSGQTDRLDEVAGLARRDEQRVIRPRTPEPITDLDRLPDPAAHFTFQHVAFTRGCPGRCTFCGSPRMWGRKVRSHSPAYFVRQLQRLTQRGVRQFYFCDDTFTLKKKLVIDICRKIIEFKLDITWTAISRVNHIDGELLGWMRRAGCLQISYGIESGSERIRKLFCKNLPVDQIENAFDLTQRYGIMARAYFIYGAPGESWQTINETMALIRRIRPLSAIFYILDIFPGTVLYDAFQHKTGAGDDIWLQHIEDILYFETDPDLSADMVLAFGKALRDDYHRQVGRFALEIELLDDPQLYRLHADFLSRLGMTFSHGDYARIEFIDDQARIAETLFRRALKYHPDRRAYLGLGILMQRSGRHRESSLLLKEALFRHPESQSLNICLAISLMALGDYSQALSHLLAFEHAPETLPHLIRCYQALGQVETARRLAGRT